MIGFALCLTNSEGIVISHRCKSRMYLAINMPMATLMVASGAHSICNKDVNKVSSLCHHKSSTMWS